MIYYDTAYLAKCYLREPGHEVVREHARAAGPITCSDIGRAELAAVFHRHFREGNLDRAGLETAFAQFASDLNAGIWHWTPVSAGLLQAVVEAFRSLPPAVFLRAADAIHLMAAKRQGCTEVFTNDRHMLRACEVFDLAGRDLMAAARNG